jgi:hypothetical protein
MDDRDSVQPVNLPATAAFEVKPWREILQFHKEKSMPKALADAKKADRKQVEKRVGKPPKHVPQSNAIDQMLHGNAAPVAEGVDTHATPVVESGLLSTNSVDQPEKTMTQAQEMSPQAKADADAAAKAEAAAKKAAETQAKIEAKEKAALERKNKADKRAADKAEVEARKAERAAKAAENKAAAEARAAELAAAGRKYVGSMLSLADRVKQGLYVKGTNGQLRSNDEVAVALDGVKPVDVIKVGLGLLQLETNPYASLNVGQQSMNLRNRLRGAVRKGTLSVEAIKSFVAEHGLNTAAAEAEAKAKAKAEREAAAAAAKAEKEAKAAAAAKVKEEAAAKKAAETQTKAESEQVSTKKAA